VHDLKLLKGGIVSEVHLCAQCAAELGVKVNNYPSADELLQHAISQQSGLLSVDIQISSSSPAPPTPSPAEAPPKPGWCPNCSTTWSEFIDRGLFGCPECYTTFEDKIGPLLERAHEGGTHHVGKFPQRGNYREDKEVRVRYLHKQLEDAVASEQFERAAQIRDQIRALAEVEGPGLSDQAEVDDGTSSQDDDEGHGITHDPSNEGGMV